MRRGVACGLPVQDRHKLSRRQYNLVTQIKLYECLPEHLRQVPLKLFQSPVSGSGIYQQFQALEKFDSRLVQE